MDYFHCYVFAYYYVRRYGGILICEYCIFVTHYNLAIIFNNIKNNNVSTCHPHGLGVATQTIVHNIAIISEAKIHTYYTQIILLSRQMFFTRRFRAHPPAYRTFGAEIKRDVLGFSMRITFAAPISPPQNLHNSQFHWVPAIRELRTHFGGPDRISSTI